MSAAPRIVLPYRGQAYSFLWVATALIAVAAIAIPFEATVVVIVAASLAVTPLVVGVVLVLVAGVCERQAAALLAGPSALSWTYADDQWREHLTAERGRGRWIGLLMTGIGGLVGLGIAAGLADDNVRPFDLAPLVWVLPPLVGALLGAAVGQVIHWHRRANGVRLAKAGGVFCVGKTGIYLTGGYWPWRGGGIALRSIRLLDGALVFEFDVARGGVQTVRVPIARGHESAARQFVEGSSQ